MALSQLSISLLNTTFTAIYLVIGLHLFGVHLPLTKTMIAITFIVGLLPIIGNLTSNTIVVIVSLAHSPAVAVASLVFLVVIHKLEYFLGARIVGSRIKSQIWELLIAMMVMEAMFGVPGLVAAPIYYAYLKSELLDAEADLSAPGGRSARAAARAAAAGSRANSAPRRDRRTSCASRTASH